MTTIACCAPTLVPAIRALPASPPMPRIRPGVAAAPARIETVAPIRLHRPAWARLGLAILEAVSAWRAASRRHAELRALATLDPHLLRDMGLAELVPPRLSASWQDIERARW